MDHVPSDSDHPILDAIELTDSDAVLVEVVKEGLSPDVKTHISKLALRDALVTSRNLGLHRLSPATRLRILDARKASDQTASGQK